MIKIQGCTKIQMETYKSKNLTLIFINHLNYRSFLHFDYNSQVCESFISLCKILQSEHDCLTKKSLKKWGKLY